MASSTNFVVSGFAVGNLTCVSLPIEALPHTVDGRAEATWRPWEAKSQSGCLLIAKLAGSANTALAGQGNQGNQTQGNQGDQQ